MGILKFDAFKEFVRLNPSIEEIELSNDGEIFLNPELIEIIKYAYVRDIRLTANNGTNFNTVSEQVLRTLVEYRFCSITISIDGSSPESYAKYRRGGNFDTVISNIQKLNEYKAMLRKGTPDLAWQYIILESTDDETEIKRAKEMANALHMRIYFKKDLNGYQPKNPAMIVSECELSYGKDFSTYAMSPVAGVKGRCLPCFQMFVAPRIGYDGSFIGCCAGWKKLPAPNCFEANLDKIMSSDIVKKIRAMVQGGPVVPESSCVDCAFFKEMSATKNYVRDEELES